MTGAKTENLTITKSLIIEIIDTIEDLQDDLYEDQIYSSNKNPLAERLKKQYHIPNFYAESVVGTDGEI